MTFTTLSYPVSVFNSMLDKSGPVHELDNTELSRIRF
jgi:hypothetical protein